MQIFPRTLNRLPVVVAVGAAVMGGVLTLGVWYYFSPANFQVGYAPDQPVPYSHRLHVGQLGMDCRYCHSSVEQSQEAQIPPSQTCMGCHAVVRADSPMLEAVRQSWETGDPVAWVRVHKLPEHAYFDHSAHVTAGVGCRSCHGRIDQMDVVTVAEPISMAWCLGCHRDPGPALRPQNRITDMQCGITGDACEGPDACCSGSCGGDGLCAPLALAATARPIMPPEHCSGCHR